jgi:hypothetical protein
VILRRDLPHGLQVAQAIHAAGESSPGNLADGTYAIALAVADEPALLREAERLRARGFERMEPTKALPAARPRTLWERCCDAVRRFARALGLVQRPAEVERLAFVPIHEPDPPYHGALMAIGILPARREVLRRHLSSLATVK